ncbi:DUF349 domain-containing protein [Raineya sp.]
MHLKIFRKRKRAVLFMMEEDKVLGNQADLVETASESLVSETEENHTEDFSHYSAEQLLHLVEKYHKKELPEQEVEEAYQLFRQTKPVFDAWVAHQKEEALHKYIAEGGEEDSFVYKPSLTEAKFYQIFNQVAKKRKEIQKKIEETLQKNLERKKEIIEKLRELIQLEQESRQTNEMVKNLQQEWRKIGAVPKGQSGNLWASYNALIDMYYSRVGIYNELKELDRKRNYEAKLAICEKAEKLAELPSIKEAIKQLTELHEEYKHIGPVGSKEDQTALWERFKKASDVIYSRKKELIEERKKELQENLAKKEALLQKAQAFASFVGEKIKQWQDATQQLMELQKEWEAIGQVPLEKSKEITKEFWHSFKVFFRRKSEFFKSLDENRQKNLEQKIALCEKAESLASNATEENLEEIAEELKKLQEQWKEIGAVPENQKEAIAERFRKVLDEFFDKRRGFFAEKDKEEKENYDKKNALCERLKNYSAEDLANFDIESLIDQAIEEWKSIGFVPRKQITKIKDKFYNALKSLAKKVEDGEKRDYVDLIVEIKWANLNGKNSAKDLAKKEQAIRKKISQLEDEISTLNNNLGFFEVSGKENAIRGSFEEKIRKTEAQIKSLKNQLKMIRSL